MKRKFLKFENIDFLAFFSSKGRCVTHEVGVANRALCNCVVRICNLYGWKEHSNNSILNNLIHINSNIEVRR